MAIRVKTQWHTEGRGGSMTEKAGVAALTGWKLASAAVDNLQKKDYTIAEPAQGFAILAELLYFIVQLADRMAYERVDDETRAAFITALANRLGDILHDNVLDIPGIDRQTDYKGQFITRLNERADDYATFGYTETGGPDFGFVRYLGLKIMDRLGERDKSWIVDQIMYMEVPEIVRSMAKALSGLFPRQDTP